MIENAKKYVKMPVRRCKGGFEEMEKDKMIRKAKLDDVKEIQHLIKLYSPRGEILPRSLSELYDHLRDFFVFIRNRKVVGICALHICWDDLAEIRSLAVQEEDRNKGIGAKLVKACLEESRLLGVKRVFALDL